MSDYTPTTEQLRDKYAQHALTSRGWPGGWVGERVDREAREEFDRWLAEHDAQVRADALREAAAGLVESGWIEREEARMASSWLTAEAEKQAPDHTNGSTR
jgi:hypothetical protein